MSHWLEKLCDPDNSRADGISQRVYAFDRTGTGEMWSFGTNGKVIAFVRGVVDGAAKRDEGKPLKHTRNFFDLPAGEVFTCSLVALKAFCGPAEWSGPLEECRECKGISRESDYVECTYCDNEGKTQTLTEAHPGFIGDVPLNRNLLAQALHAVGDDDTVQVSLEPKETGKDHFIRVIGRDWRVCLVSVNADVAKDTALNPEWEGAPRFELRGAAEAVAVKESA